VLVAWSAVYVLAQVRDASGVKWGRLTPACWATEAITLSLKIENVAASLRNRKGPTSSSDCLFPVEVWQRCCVKLDVNKRVARAQEGTLVHGRVPSSPKHVTARLTCCYTPTP
jgi:hypothetical protein